MEDRRLDLIVCDVCKNEFADGEQGYEISRTKFSEEFKVFDPVRVGYDNLELPSIRRVIRFHERCFEEIAGDSFKV